MRSQSAPVVVLLFLAMACGGGQGPGAAQQQVSPPAGGGGDPGGAGGGGGAGGAGAPPGPGTPAPAPFDPAPAPVGGSGSNRFEVGAALGLYVVDPAAGEPSVQGFVVVTLGPIGSGNFIPPDDTVVTLNGVALLRDPNLNGAYWRVDPAGPQPVVGSGGRMVIVAKGTVLGALVSRTLVLPCPSDVDVISTPAVGAVLTPAPAPARPLHLTSASDITLNVGIAAMNGIFPTAMLDGFDPATRTIVPIPSGSVVIVPPGPLDVSLPVLDTPAPAYLLDLRWPGPWVIDGETGGFCGLVKRWTYAK